MAEPSEFARLKIEWLGEGSRDAGALGRLSFYPEGCLGYEGRV